METIQKILTTYEVNPNTMAILPKEIARDVYAIVKEIDDEFMVLKRPTDIIKRSCSFFGSDYSGRVSGTKTLTGITHKPPIAISPSSKLFFFPTTSSSHHACAWIAHSHVKKIQKTPPNYTLVQLSNHASITLPVSIGSFSNQLHRTAQLRSAHAELGSFHQENRHFELINENEVESYIKKKKLE